MSIKHSKEKKGGGGKPWNCENFRKIIKCSNPHTSLPIFIYSVKSLKIISIMHNWHVLERNNQYSSYFDTFLKKSSQILIRIEMHTSSEHSGMESSLLKHIFLGFLVTCDVKSKTVPWPLKCHVGTHLIFFSRKIPLLTKSFLKFDLLWIQLFLTTS